MVEDRRAVLAADIEALAVAGGRVLYPPERLKQFRVADLDRVEPHLDRLGVAGAVPTDLSVGGVRDVPAGVADGGLQHSVDLAEGRLDTPEASCGECRALGSVRSGSLERRCRRRANVAVPELDHVMTPSNICPNTRPAPGIPARARGDAAPAGSKPPKGTRPGTSQPVRPHARRLRALSAHDPCGTASTALSQSATALAGAGGRCSRCGRASLRQRQVRAGRGAVTRRG